jgi:hypothetical protein
MDELITAMNRAAEAAVPEAKALLQAGEDAGGTVRNNGRSSGCRTVG